MTNPPDDPALRPKSLANFVGQPYSRKLLSMAIAGAKARREPLEHVLLSGPPGLGKTTLAQILASEMQSGFRSISAPSISRVGDLAAALVSMQPHDILFLDEIHRLPIAVAEILYGAMEDYRLDILAGEDGAGTPVSIPLPRFTLVGATTRPGQLPRPLRDRFGLDARLEPYAVCDLAIIVERSAELLGMSLGDCVPEMVAVRSRGTPRIANRMLRRLRDFVGEAVLTGEVAGQGFAFLGVDGDGLDERDRRYLACLRERGRPVGVKTLAAVLGEDVGTIEEEIEPWLVGRGLVDRIPQGRVIVANSG